MKAILSILFLTLLLGTLDAQEQDSLQNQTQYRKAWDAAMANGIVSQEERVLLNIMVESLLLSIDSSRAWEQQWLPEMDKPLDQSGRWPLVLQNIAIGSGLYGWGIPYVLHADDERWYVGGVMVSAGGAFYLTYKYTQDLEMSHARTQMMRYGSLLGLRYGFGLNTILDLDDGLEDYYDEEDNAKDPETLWMWMLMASVPAGHYGGEYIFDEYHPTNGQAWAWSLWTGIAGATSRLIYNAATERPDTEYNEFGDDAENEDLKKWEKGRTITELLTYPVGVYYGYQLSMDKNYSFGDALMLIQGYGFGYMNTMMLQSIFFDGGDEDAFLLVAGLGAIGSTLAYDRYILDDDFSFGQSTLMLLGSASGTAFGFGTAILFKITDKEPMLALAIAGYGTGTWLTRKIVDVKPDGSMAVNNTTKVSFMPTVLPNLDDNEKVSLIPGIDLRIEFK